MAKIGFWQSQKRDVGTSPAVSDVAEAHRAPPAVVPPVYANAAFGRQDATLLLRTYEQSGQGWFWSTDGDGRLTYLSPGIASLLGIAPTDVAGTVFADLFAPDSEACETRRTLPFLLTKKSRFEKLTLRAASSDADCWWAVSGTPQFDASGEFTGYRGNGFDITEQRRSSEHASKLAKNDSLTGLPNRLRMAEVLEADLVALEYQKRSCAVMLIDLDRFKQVNDTLGHPAGDALLIQVADRLTRIIGDADRIFRLGGDEFQIIVRDCDDRGKLGDLANQIIAMLSQPYSVQGSRCIIGASVGVAISPYDGRTREDLIRNADLALYAAKASGRGRFRFFANELLEAAEDRRVLEEDLRDALGNGEISVFYQPSVDATTNITTGVEALIRWHHPVRGPVSPALFIPIAEETSLIESLGEWVLRKACEDAATWPGKLRVAVNVSPIQFSKDSLPAIVTSALAQSGLSPDRLELEITEGVFLSDSAATDTMFATLKEIGVRLALDDFGTGYSSLSYLRTAPFDKIKIDQSFVRAATLPRSRNRAIIAAIVALAEALGMETTAEGIESHDQLELMRTLKVSHIQGYIYSKPIPCDALTEQLASGAWQIAPAGPDKQRAERLSMYRNVGAIFGNYYRSVLIRNLSESGALIEGLMEVPLGSLLLIDFGEGQLAFARVRRSGKRQCGIEFEQPLVSDGNGGMCTSHRVSPYLLSRAGLPTAQAPGVAPGGDGDGSGGGGGSGDADPSALERLRIKLGLGHAPGATTPGTWEAGPSGSSVETGAGGAAAAPASNAVDGSTDGAAPAAGTNGARGASAIRRSPTIKELSERYLNHVSGDARRHDIDARYLREEILPRFGALRPDELSPSHIAEWLAIKVKEEGFPPAKVSRLQGILGQMYVLAMQWGMPGSGGDALQGISLFNRGARERCLTSEEIERLQAATSASPNPQLKHIVSLLMLTGTRQRELLEAQWEHVDLANAIWRIPTSEPGKERSVSLSRAAVEILEALPRSPECSRVIINPTTRKPYRSLFNSWDSARRKAGLADVEIDDLRHSASVGESVSGLTSIEAVKTILRRPIRKSVDAPTGLGL